MTKTTDDHDDARQSREDEPLITSAGLARLIPYSKVHIARLEKAGKFPRRIKLGPNRVAWWRNEIFEWIAERERETRESYLKSAPTGGHDGR